LHTESVNGQWTEQICCYFFRCFLSPFLVVSQFVRIFYEIVLLYSQFLLWGWLEELLLFKCMLREASGNELSWNCDFWMSVEVSGLCFKLLFGEGLDSKLKFNLFGRNVHLSSLLIWCSGFLILQNANYEGDQYLDFRICVESTLRFPNFKISILNLMSNPKLLNENALRIVRRNLKTSIPPFFVRIWMGGTLKDLSFQNSEYEFLFLDYKLFHRFRFFLRWSLLNKP
jgi:hypothetical protein